MTNNDTPARVCHSVPGRSRCRRQTADTAVPLVHDTVDGYNFSDGAAKIIYAGHQRAAQQRHRHQQRQHMCACAQA